MSLGFCNQYSQPEGWLDNATTQLSVIIHRELYERDVLDKYLSRALNVDLENGRLTIIDDSAYVLTLDYTLKMLNIHERFMCGVPVIIEGETGVGKTALVEMLSKLWNQSLLLEWKKQRSRLLDFFRDEINDTPGGSKPGDYEVSPRHNGHRQKIISCL